MLYKQRMELKEKVNIIHKDAIVKAAARLKKGYSMLFFKAFMELYIEARDEGGIWDKVPDDIRKELNKGEHKSTVVVRLRHDMTVVAGERPLKYIDGVEELRMYADKKYAKDNRIGGVPKVNLGMLMISKAYLSAEQAAKTNKTIFESILSNIENGNIRDKKKSLPEVYGITGKQMKFLLRIYQGVYFIS